MAGCHQRKKIAAPSTILTQWDTKEKDKREKEGLGPA